MAKYLFGPVPSRRLGMSLGVDLVPYKTCSLDCVYCECGDTTVLTNERKEYIPTKEVLAELAGYLSSQPELDYITFSGAGEPTLHSGIEEIIFYLKKSYPQYKICLLTNATLLHDKTMHDALMQVDLIVPSLDASNEEEFLKINRPANGVTLEMLIRNLNEFRHEAKAVFWLELFVVPGVNNSSEAIARFSNIIQQLKPDKVQLNSLDRPGCVDWIRPATREECQPFMDAFKSFVDVEIVGKFKQVKVMTAANLNDLVELVSELISRRPCTSKDVSISLGIDENLVQNALDDLNSKGNVVTETRERGVFYRTKG